jgi:hypothetical protein
MKKLDFKIEFNYFSGHCTKWYSVQDRSGLPYHLFKLNKIKRSSTINTGIYTKYNMPTFFCLNFTFTRFIAIIITK